MKRLVVFLCAMSLLFGVTGLAQANLITDGDFQTGTQPLQQNFNPESGPFGIWLSQPDRWPVLDDGQGIGGPGDYYAKHLEWTLRLFQGFEVNPVDLPSGTLLNLSFNYIYQSGFLGIEQAAVHVLGLMGADDAINVWAPFNNPGVELFAGALPSYEQDWVSFSSEFIVPADYDAIAVIFTAGAFGENTGGLRGIDNVSLNPVPEPATMLLLGSGLIGLAGLGRKKFFKRG